MATPYDFFHHLQREHGDWLLADQDPIRKNYEPSGYQNM